MGKKGLNPKQLAFVRHYVQCHNATQAALQAGYAKPSAHSQGHDLLKHPEIKRMIASSATKIAEQADLQAADVLAEIRRIGFSDLTEAFDDDGTLIPFKKMPVALRRSIQAIETDEIFAGRGIARKKIGHTRKIKAVNKLHALEMLAKHFKLLTDVHEHSGKDGAPLVVVSLPANGSESTAGDEPAELKKQLSTLSPQKDS